LDSGLPPIVAVDTGFLKSYWQRATSHAVVMMGFKDSTIFVNDPAIDTAPQVISLTEFEAAWIEQDYLYAIIGLERF
jgi:hypothetical protein